MLTIQNLCTIGKKKSDYRKDVYVNSKITLISHILNSLHYDALNWKDIRQTAAWFYSQTCKLMQRK